MQKAIHPATKKRADKLGVEIANISETGILLIRTADKHEYFAEGASLAEALDEVQDETAEFQAPKTTRLTCGVMPSSHHARYMSQGGGCADVLDTTMRALFATDDGIDTASLKLTGETNGLWNPRWETLNPGMQRMNLANRLRAAARRGTEIALIGPDGMRTAGLFGIVPKEQPAPKAKKAAAPKAEAKPAKKTTKRANKPKLGTAQPEA